MESKITANVPEFKKLFEGSKDVVFFTIKIKADGNEWKLQKRFSELHKLHEDLLHNHGNLPSFPKKTLFPLKNYEDIDNRRMKLSIYIEVV